jgi:hypothetical protein
MTTAEVLKEVSLRGLKVVVEGGSPRLKGDPRAASPALLKVLALHRDKLLAMLAPEYRLREWLFDGGLVVEETPGMASVGNPEMKPGLALWWRYRGEKTWRMYADCTVDRRVPQSLYRVGEGRPAEAGTGATADVVRNLPGSRGQQPEPVDMAQPDGVPVCQVLEQQRLFEPGRTSGVGSERI